MVRANPAAERLFGYGDGEIAGRAADVLAAPESAGRFLDITSPTRPSVPARLFMRTRHGRVFSATVSAIPCDGHRILSILPVESGSESDRILAMIVEGIPDAFALWNPEGRLALCNNRYRELYGAVAERLVPGLAYEDYLREIVARGIVSVDPAESLESWIQGRVARRQERFRTCDEQFADGRWLRIHTHRTDDGYIIGMQTDISRFKRREELLIEKEVFYRSFADELIAARERLKEQTSRLAALAETQYVARERAEAASLAKSQFLAAMSHELRTPLNAILGFSEILQMEAFGKLGHDKYREYAADIHISGRHLLDLINDVLDMSKIEAGKYELNLEACRLDRIVTESVRLVAGRAIEAGVKVVNRVADLDRAVIGDPRAIKQCLINLLANGVKFTPRGGTVKIEAEIDEAYVRIRVSDTGLGIPEEDIPRITQPFVQSKRGGESWSEGTGLGLALTKSLIEMHQGALAIRSAIGRGTIVTVTLPTGGPSRAPQKEREGALEKAEAKGR